MNSGNDSLRWKYPKPVPKLEPKLAFFLDWVSLRLTSFSSTY